MTGRGPGMPAASDQIGTFRNPPMSHRICGEWEKVFEIAIICNY